MSGGGDAQEEEDDLLTMEVEAVCYARKGQAFWSQRYLCQISVLPPKHSVNLGLGLPKELPCLVFARIGEDTTKHFISSMRSLCCLF